MKDCTRCKTTKPLDGFYRVGKRLHSWCKPCFNEYVTGRWKDRKVAVVKRMGGVCVDCGLKHKRSNTVVFDLHHTTGTDDKVGDWKTMRLMSDEKLDRELAKCILLCANCHRLRHAREDDRRRKSA